MTLKGPSPLLKAPTLSKSSPPADTTFAYQSHGRSRTAFRFINLFRGWVDIPAYEKNRVEVPAQHLPDTEVQPIVDPTGALIGEDHTAVDFALMQGFLTLPFIQD